MLINWISKADTRKVIRSANYAVSIYQPFIHSNWKCDKLSANKISEIFYILITGCRQTETKHETQTFFYSRMWNRLLLLPSLFFSFPFSFLLSKQQKYIFLHDKRAHKEKFFLPLWGLGRDRNRLNRNHAFCASHKGFRRKKCSAGSKGEIVYCDCRNEWLLLKL